jgi:hypothetical protein
VIPFRPGAISANACSIAEQCVTDQRLVILDHIRHITQQHALVADQADLGQILG